MRKKESPGQLVFDWLQAAVAVAVALPVVKAVKEFIKKSVSAPNTTANFLNNNQFL